jgi:trk system potassium uptake protein TrkH
MRYLGIPAIIWFTAMLGAAMAGPGLFAFIEADWRSARMFMYSSLFTLAICAILGAASRSARRPQIPARGELLTYAGCFAAAPIMAGIPFALLEPSLGAQGAYFEAVSSLTTTGATMLPRPEEASQALHLWRAALGWIGGLTTLVAAAAVLGPRGLLDVPGGAEGRRAGEVGDYGAGRGPALGAGGLRTWRSLSHVFPLYLGLTALLTVALAAGGGDTFTALCHAMGVMSTSGISPSSDGMMVHSSRLAEAAALIFMIFAASRLPWLPRLRLARARRMILDDPELRLLLITVAVATIWLFTRHWLGALTFAPPNLGTGDTLAALWGTVATVVSFVTTTGYVSADWQTAQTWSGLSNPALLLLGLAALGGGVASTAGGVKLYRAFTLFQHGLRELASLSHPAMVDRPRTPGGRLGREAVLNALVFTMLFMATLSIALLALTLAGMPFERALIGAISALSNTGPAFPLVEQDPAVYANLSWIPRMILCIAMILGRIEILAVVALMNPGWWRR